MSLIGHSRDMYCDFSSAPKSQIYTVISEIPASAGKVP